MKVSSSWLLLISVVCLFFSCGKERYPERLVMADSLVSVKPDSARQILARMAKDTADMPTSHKMYYKLLVLKADVKLRIDPKSDGLSTELVRYYEHNGDKHLLPQAYYYAASVYRDMNDASLALEYFQKTLDTLPKDSGNLLLRSYCYNQMAKLFLFQNLTENALSYFIKSYKVDSIRNDTADMVFSLCDIAMAYQGLEKYDESLKCLYKAKNINYDMSTPETDSQISYMVSVLLTDKGLYDSAWVYLQEPLRDKRYLDRSALYSTAAKICLKKQWQDSASFYCNEILGFGSVYAKQKAVKSLAQIAFDRKQVSEGLHYIKMYDVYTDSVAKLEAISALTNANSLYNYQIREKENVRLKLEKKNDVLIILGTVFTSVVLILLFTVYSVRSKQRQQRLNTRIFLLEKLERENKVRSESEIEMKRMEIKNLTKKLYETDRDKTELQKQLEESKGKLDLAIENRRKVSIRQDNQKMKLLKSRAFSISQTKLAKGMPITSLEWNEIEEELDTILDDFKFILHQACNVSPLEYHICLLIKLGYKNVEIGTLICRAPNSVSQCRKRLYQKITGKEGSSSNFDELIKSL